MGKKYDLTGWTFGRLEVLKRSPELRRSPCGSTSPAWICRCACGAVCVVEGRSLVLGRTRSCGCLRRENARRQGAARWKERRQRANSAGETRKRRNEYARTD